MTSFFNGNVKQLFSLMDSDGFGITEFLSSFIVYLNFCPEILPLATILTLTVWKGMKGTREIVA